MPVIIAVGILVLLIFLVLVFYVVSYIKLVIYFSSSLQQFFPPSLYVGMRLRRVPPSYIVERYVMLQKAGLTEITMDQLESHFLANGDLYAVTEAIKEATKANLNVTFEKICAIDLAGRDVLRAVGACVNPVVIQVPVNGELITGVCKDGIRLGARVQVTAKADIDKLIGGANEETLEARIGEGIVSTMGKAQSHQEILQDPDLITQSILSKGLDNSTAYSIVSVDVSAVKPLDNIGAKLQEDQADADRLVAQSNAEERRALAAAITQENKAKIIQMTIMETENTAVLPTDVAASYRSGNIWRSPNPLHSVMKRNLWDASN